MTKLEMHKEKWGKWYNILRKIRIFWLLMQLLIYGALELFWFKGDLTVSAWIIRAVAIVVQFICYNIVMSVIEFIIAWKMPTAPEGGYGYCKKCGNGVMKLISTNKIDTKLENRTSSATVGGGTIGVSVYDGERTHTDYTTLPTDKITEHYLAAVDVYEKLLRCDCCGYEETRQTTKDA